MAFTRGIQRRGSAAIGKILKNRRKSSGIKAGNFWYINTFTAANENACFVAPAPDFYFRTSFHFWSVSVTPDGTILNGVR
jgi:hypothetical protein